MRLHLDLLKWHFEIHYAIQDFAKISRFTTRFLIEMVPTGISDLNLRKMDRKHFRF